MKKTILGIGLLLGLLLALLVWRGDEETPLPRVTEPNSTRMPPAGTVVGFADDYETYAWLGIPFAEPPVGKLRWRAPGPAQPWEGTLEALEYGDPCTQLWGEMSGVAGSAGNVVGNEDCLYLNIWAPAMPTREAEQARLPVMVWIHGGGNAIGTANTYPGPHLAGSQQIVYVAINYRLGLFGWLSHEALQGEGRDALDASGNYGVLDMIAALRWVQENIASFGGDPNNITIFGESAGGRNVYALLGSPLAEGLFHRAIAQSGSLQTTPRPRAENLNDAAEPGEPNSSSEILLRLLQADGGAADRDEAITQLAGMTPGEIENYLYRKTPSEIYGIFGAPHYGMFRAPQNFRDGTVLPLESLLQRFSDTRLYNDVPLIAGSNRDEYKVFMAQDPRFVNRRFGLFPDILDPTSYDQISGYLSDQWKALAVDEPAAVMSRNGGPEVYAYRFDWDEAPSTWMVDFPTLLGAGHGLEISFVLGDFEGGISIPYLYTDENEAGRLYLSSAMMDYWAEFARSGKPGRGKLDELPLWRPWGESDETFLILDTAEDGGIRMTDEQVTAEQLKQRLAADGGFEEPEHRCAMYANMFLLSYQVTDFWNEQEFKALGDGACAAYSPYDFEDKL